MTLFLIVATGAAVYLRLVASEKHRRDTYLAARAEERSAEKRQVPS
jgi:hypothetical protein